jgi:hypothetical protein
MDYYKIEMIFEMLHLSKKTLVYNELCKQLNSNEINLLNRLRLRLCTDLSESDTSDSSEEEDKQIKRDRELIDIFQACIKDIKRKGLQK